MTATTASKKRASRRERLLARRRPTLDYQLEVIDPTDAFNELVAAKEALDVARYRDDEGADQAITDAEKRVAKARAAVEDCYEAIPLTALPPAEFEAMVAKPEYAPREDKDERWNGETFPRACFLACVDTSDLTAEEWAGFLEGNVAQGEREHLYLVAVGLNARQPSGSLPSV